MLRQSYSKLLILGILFLVLVLLSGCTNALSKCDMDELVIITGQHAKLVDKSLITQEPCAAPCWYGIVPGKTSFTKAAEILRTLDFVDTNSLDVRTDLEPGAIVWKTVFPDDRIATTGIYFDKNGVVTEIYRYQIWYRLTLDELIGTIGEPDGIIIQPSALPHGSVDCWYVNVVWFNKGLVVRVDNQPISGVNDASVESDDLVYSVIYSPPVSSLDELIALEGDSTFRNRFKEWEGFSQ